LLRRPGPRSACGPFRRTPRCPRHPGLKQRRLDARCRSFQRQSGTRAPPLAPADGGKESHLITRIEDGLSGGVLLASGHQGEDSEGLQARDVLLETRPDSSQGGPIGHLHFEVVASGQLPETCEEEHPDSHPALTSFITSSTIASIPAATSETRVKPLNPGVDTIRRWRSTDTWRGWGEHGAYSSGRPE